MRMGLHTGEAIAEEGDFFGRNVDPRGPDRGAGARRRDPRLRGLREPGGRGGRLAFDEGRELELKGMAGTHGVHRAEWETEAAAALRTGAPEGAPRSSCLRDAQAEVGSGARSRLAVRLSSRLPSGARAAAASALARDFENPASPITSQQFGPASVQRQDTPTDPDYDIAEPDDEDVVGSTNLYDERFDLFGFPSQLHARTPLYRAGPERRQAADLRLQRRRGVEGSSAAAPTRRSRSSTPGSSGTSEDLRTRSTSTRASCRCPEHADGTTCAAYDCDGDGVFNVVDYASDPRVSRHCGGPHGPLTRRRI